MITFLFRRRPYHRGYDWFIKFAAATAYIIATCIATTGN